MELVRNGQILRKLKAKINRIVLDVGCEIKIDIKKFPKIFDPSN